MSPIPARACFTSLLVATACGCAAPEDGRGRIMSAELVESLTLDELKERLDAQSPLIRAAVEPEFPVDVYRVLYETIDAHGGLTLASGVVAVPGDASHELPLLSYQHGTLVRTQDAPSTNADGERLIALGTAGAGCLAALPDYLGLGLGRGFHPYVHRATEASAAVDLMRAAKRLVDDLGLTTSGDVFLTGYSQGGHATMATAMTIETTPALKEELGLTAVAPMAGPYDVSGVQADVILQDEPYPDPSYLPYVILAYDSVYGLFDDLDEVLVEPYATLVPQLFDGSTDPSAINEGLPAVPKEMLRPDLVERFESNPAHPLRFVLADNDVTGWTPAIPLRMYHCEADAHVPFANAEAALARFEERGSTTVELVSMGESLGHLECVLPSLLDAKLWFDGFVRGR